MRTVGIGRLSWNDGVEAVGESVLHGRSNADVGLHPGDDHALYPLFAQEKRKIGGEKRAVPALGAHNFAGSRGAESFEESGVGIADEMVVGQLPPLIVVEARIMPLDRMDDDAPAARAAASNRRRGSSTALASG